MRKQLRASDLYQSAINVPILQRIHGVKSIEMAQINIRALHEQVIPETCWRVKVTFTDNISINEIVHNVGEIRTFVKHVNSYITDTPEVIYNANA